MSIVSTASRCVTPQRQGFTVNRHWLRSAVALLAFIVGSTATASHDLWLDEFADVLPVTLSNLKQNPRDVAGSLTVFTRDDIERRQFRDLYDVMRSVPGMTVVNKSAPLQVVDHAGSGTYLGRGLEIQVNGISQTMPSHSTAFMDFLPPLEAIDRIEILRGSNAASDGGSKSFKGTVNIIMRAPDYNDETYLSAQSDSLGRRNLYSYFNPGNERHHLSLAGRYYEEEGFHRYDGKTTDEQPPVVPLDDDARSESLYLQYINELTIDSRINLDLSYFDGNYTVPGMSFIADAAPDASDAQLYHTSLAGRFNHRFANNEMNIAASIQQWEFDQNFEGCGPVGLLSPQASIFAQNNIEQVPALVSLQFDQLEPGPELLALLAVLSQDSNQQPFCGIMPQSIDMQRSGIDIKNVMQVSDGIKWVAGLDADFTVVDGFLFDDERHYDSFRGYSHVQWNYDRLVTNVGIANERYIGENSVSSRLGANYHLDDSNTVRFVLAKGKKTPDVADVDDAFGTIFIITEDEYFGTTQHLIYDGGQLQKNQRAQVVYNQEIGYLWRPSRFHSLDVRLFRDRYQNLSFYSIYLALVPDPDSVVKEGLELQYSGFSDRLYYGATMHYHDSSSNHAEENYILYGSSAYLSIPFDNDVELIVNGYYSNRRLGWLPRTTNVASTIVDVEVAKTFSRRLRIGLSLRRETTPFLSRVYFPDIYAVDYEDDHAAMLKLRYELD